jgi:hypothetical protein
MKNVVTALVVLVPMIALIALRVPVCGLQTSWLSSHYFVNLFQARQASPGRPVTGLLCSSSEFMESTALWAHIVAGGQPCQAAQIKRAAHE